MIALVHVGLWSEYVITWPQSARAILAAPSAYYRGGMAVWIEYDQLDARIRHVMIVKDYLGPPLGWEHIISAVDSEQNAVQGGLHLYGEPL